MGEKILVAKLRGVKSPARGKEIVKQLGDAEIKGINVCTDLGSPINYRAVACVLQDERFAATPSNNTGSEGKWGILHYAAHDGNKDVCDLVLQRGDFRCGTAVTEAADIAQKAGHADLAEFLRGSAKRERVAKFFASETEEEADDALNSLEENSELSAEMLCNFGLSMKLTPITANALLDSASAKEFLLAKDEDNWTMLHWAAFKNNYELVRRIVDDHSRHAGGIINATNDSGQTAFSMAVSSGEYGIAHKIQCSDHFIFEEPDTSSVPPNLLAELEDRWLPLWRLKACRIEDDCASLVKRLRTLEDIDLVMDFGWHDVNYIAIRALLDFAKKKEDDYWGCDYFDVDNIDEYYNYLEINEYAYGYDLLRSAVEDGEAGIVEMLVMGMGFLNDFEQRYPDGVGSEFPPVNASNILHICVARTTEEDVTLRLLEALSLHQSAMAALSATDGSGKTPKDVAKAVHGVDSSIYKFLHQKDTIHRLAQTSEVDECRRIVESLTESLTEPLQCKICLKDNIGVALSCGHQLCATCVTKMTERGPGGCEKCPFCRAAVTSKIKLFFN
ncbi:unnamed protein product [Amoebophrya sp. A25]|nr:unnamed protein product [Amoebophrya sp. A25]|eukprot:GSA25T00024150001.1